MANESTDASFKLQDRTAVLAGPCNIHNQAIAMKLTQLGANVAMLVANGDRQLEKAQRFSQQLMDTREVNERYGRSYAIQGDFATPNSVKDTVSRAAEAFGGIDIFIDGAMITEAIRFRDPRSIDNIDKFIETNLRAPMMMTQGVLRFLEGRKRGRIIYLMHDILRTGIALNALGAGTRTGLSDFSKSLAREVAEFNITVNCIAIGVSEDFLSAQISLPTSDVITGAANVAGASGTTGTASSGASSASSSSASNSSVGGGTMSIQEAQLRLQQTYPFATLTEPEKIANLVAFLASPMGAGITGQTIAVSQGLSFLS
jgi:NAD(P)-dependent dehydrogenase (short-subunit alcohol dehydrogenase family)